MRRNVFTKGEFVSVFYFCSRALRANILNTSMEGKIYYTFVGANRKMESISAPRGPTRSVSINRHMR